MTDIASRWAARETAVQPQTQPSPTVATPVARYRHYKPFVSAVDRYVSEAQDGERIYFGVDEFDLQIRGVGRGQLCLIVGYSHSGKTLLLAHILRHNRDKRVVLFSPDEPAQLVLAKLASQHFGVPADEIEDRVTKGDQEAIELLRRTALEAFPNLIVFDQPLRGEDMDAALAEAETVWNEKAECVVLDYLDLLQAGDTVQSKGEFVKAFGSRHNVPMIVIHQSSRTAGTDGKAQTISSGAYGGEQLATFQLGVWRKKSAIAAQLVEVRDKIARAANGATDSMMNRQDELLHEMERAEYTVTVAITKNKRPGRREGREEIDFELYGDTGLLAPLADGELPRQYLAVLGRRQELLKEQVPQQPSEPVWSEDELWEEEF